MFDFKPESVINSEVIPGVSFTVLGPSYHRRIMFDKAVAEFRSLARITGKRVAVLETEIADASKRFDAQKAEAVKGMRAAIEEEQDADVRSALQAELDVKLAAGFQISESIIDELDELNSKSIRQLAELHNAPRVKIYCKSIEGLTIDGKPATIKSLLDEGPVLLVHEILAAIDQASRAQAADLKNLQLPSISSSPEDGKTNDTTATDANAPAGTKAETAANSPS